MAVPASKRARAMGEYVRQARIVLAETQHVMCIAYEASTAAYGRINTPAGLVDLWIDQPLQAAAPHMGPYGDPATTAARTTGSRSCPPSPSVGQGESVRRRVLSDSVSRVTGNVTLWRAWARYAIASSSPSMYSLRRRRGRSPLPLLDR